MKLTVMIALSLLFFSALGVTQPSDTIQAPAPPGDSGSRFQSYLEAVRAQRLRRMEERRQALREQSKSQQEKLDRIREEREYWIQQRDPIPPHYWNNGWYYRGY